MAPNDISLPYGMKPREIATKLIANGYRPCPLQPRSKAITVPNWTRRTFLPEDFGPDRGVGLKTGNGLVALDIDVYDATMAEELVRVAVDIFGPTLIREGQSPKKALLYRSYALNQKFEVRLNKTQMTPDKKSNKIELLSLGQQVVVAAIHPETGLPYKWLGEAPWMSSGVTLDDLPEITKDKWSSFQAALSDVADALPSPSPIPARPDVANNGMEQTRATEAETLSFLSEALKLAPNDLDREEWVKLAASLKVEFGDTLRDEFLAYSFRYVKGDCTTKEATHVWNSAVPHTVTSVAPALSLLKGRMTEDAWKVLWRDIFKQRDTENVPHITSPEINETRPKEVHEKQIDPVDLWDKFDPPELPRGLLPKIIEEFAVLNGKQMGADPAGLAMGALVTCAAAIPDRVRLKVKQYDDWFESARIWSALVGPPSTKKSPTIKRATSPLSKLDKQMMANWVERVNRFDALKNDQKKGKQRPKQTRLRLEDTTVEAAQQVLEGSPWGILMLQDELSGFFGAMDKYNGGKGAQADRAFWLQSFDGGPYAVNRVTRGSAIIPNVSVSLLGGIQPEPIRKIAGDAVDDGLLQRLFPISLRTASIGADEPMPPINQDYEKLIIWLRKLVPHGFLQDGYWSFSADAQLIRRELEAKHLSLQSLESINRKLASHIGKYDGLFARLCVIWHFVEYFDPTSSKCSKSDIPTEISGATAKRVAGFLHEFLLPHALTFYSAVLPLSDDYDRLQALAGYILAHKLEVVKNRHMHRGDRQMRKLTDREIRVVFEQLEALGWLERLDPPKPSSPPHWHVNPLVHTKFKARAKEERKRREATKRVIQSIAKKTQ